MQISIYTWYSRGRERERRREVEEDRCIGACCVDRGYLILLPSPRESKIWGLYSQWVGGCLLL